MARVLRGGMAVEPAAAAWLLEDERGTLGVNCNSLSSCMAGIPLELPLMPPSNHRCGDKLSSGRKGDR
jgi:hypothetical protein